jgi:predicted ATP-binding protein involved in virulence
MYFKSIHIENVGPIVDLEIDFHVNEHPKPIIIVGENGTGKSILLSYLVNCLITGKQHIFDDVEVEQGKVYKYRSPHYITSGKDYSYASVKFDSGSEFQECQLRITKKDFETALGYIPISAKTIWLNMPETEFSTFNETLQHNASAISDLYKKQCCLYFPVNRFEEPAWLNLDNLKAKTNYSDLKLISRYSNRNIICTSPLKSNKDWLLDVIFDRQAFELKTGLFPFTPQPGQPAIPLNIFAGYSGQSTTIYEAIINIVKVILREQGNIRLGAGTRKQRQISVMKDEKVWIPNLFQLSTGEVQLLNLFISIVRDYDLSEGVLNNLNDIKGIVIIDEIDSHLHTSHQNEVLPELIASFPNVQFVITTHSPLFLMGMEKKFGTENFIIFNMPNGEQVASSDFSEFNAAYEAFKETTKHREEIRSELEQLAKPIVFVEGEYDVRYLNRAAVLLNKEKLLDGIQLRESGGSGNLDKIWKGYNNPMSEMLPNKIVLLYDCDTNKQNDNKGLVYKRVIPSYIENPISIGIENLFPESSIQRVESQNPQYIDIQDQVTIRIRNETTTQPTIKSVNKDEKGNMCNWLCEQGSVHDFANFAAVFSIIETIVN